MTEDQSIRQDADPLPAWHGLRAGITTLGAIAMVWLYLSSNGSAWLAAIWVLWAVNSWPCVFSRPLRQYHRLPGSERRNSPKPFAFWVELITAISLLGAIVAGVTRLLLVGYL